MALLGNLGNLRARQKAERDVRRQEALVGAGLESAPGSPEQIQQGLLAGLPALTKSDPALSGALAGEAIRSPQGRGLLQQLSSPFQTVRDAGERTAQNIRDISRRKFEDVLAGEQLINEAVDFQGQRIRASMAPTVALIEAGQDVKRLLAQGSAVASEAAITRVARALSDDAVREGEQKRILQSVGGADFLMSQFNALGGKGMTPKAQIQFLETMDALIAERALAGVTRIEGFDTEARAQNITPERIKAMFQTAGVNPRTLVQAVMKGMTPEQMRAFNADQSQ